MSVIGNENPAIYGPVDGVYVTLSEWLAWQTSEYAKNQAAASEQFDQYVEESGIPAANPYVVPNTPAPPATAPPATKPAATSKPVAHLYGDIGNDSYCDYYPFDPLCGWWGGGGITSGGSGNLTTYVTIINQGLGSTEIASMVDGSLRSVWAAEVSTVDAAIAVVVAEVQTALTGLGNAVKAAYSIAARLAGFILNALTTLLRELLKGLLKVLQDIREVLKHIYEDVLKPLAAAMAKLRQRLMDIYEKFIRPVLIVIQDIRKVLGMLAAFHVPFAAKLDRKLGELERRITGPFLLLLRYTNAVANWVNLIITNGYLLQRSVFLQSVKAYIGSMMRLQFNSINQPPSAADVAAGRQAITPPSPHQTDLDTKQFLTTGQGPLAAPVAETSAYFESLLKNGLPG